jgi:TolB-like protein/Tfp pilus assembly protein PilF
VQLWEKAEGLPVHRLNHQARASVYGYTAEIDAWLIARSMAAAPAGGPIVAPSPSTVAPARPAVAVLPKKRSESHNVLLFAGLLTLIIALFTVAILRHRLTEPPATPVLAVLPFQNQTSTDDSLADGLTDGLTADLQRIENFKVIARQSVSQFKGRQIPIDQVAGELHASLALQGTVAQVGDKTQVTVELVDAPHNTHLWGATYTRQSGDVLALEDEITSQIATDVTRKITGSAPQVVFPAAAVDPRARQAYLDGRFYWNQRDLPGLRKAIAAFGQAIAIDPRYGAAYSGLAESYDLMTDRGVISNDEAFRRARAAAATALSLDPGSAEAYNALAMAVYRQDWDFATAEQYFQKAIQLDPNYAVAHQWYGEFLGDMRRFDASIAELKKARELDPLSPMVSCDLADGYLHAGRVVEADAELNRVLELYPDFLSAHGYRITLLVVESKFDQAEAEARLFASQTGDSSVIQAVEIRRLAAEGNLAAARSLLHNLLSASREGPDLDSYSVAQLDFATGQYDAGYGNLEKAYRDHSWWLVTMLVDPGFDSVRAQPRFLDLVRRVGLPSQNLSLALR